MSKILSVSLAVVFVISLFLGAEGKAQTKDVYWIHNRLGNVLELRSNGQYQWDFSGNYGLTYGASSTRKGIWTQQNDSIVLYISPDTNEFMIFVNHPSWDTTIVEIIKRDTVILVSSNKGRRLEYLDESSYIPTKNKKRKKKMPKRYYFVRMKE